MTDVAKTMDFDFDEVTFLVSREALTSVMKPVVIKHALEGVGAQSVIYIDNNIWVTDSLRAFENHLSKFSAVMTSNVPTPTQGETMNLNSLASGALDLSIFALRNTQTTINFLTFWSEQLSLTKSYQTNWGQYIPAFFDTDNYLVLPVSQCKISYRDQRNDGAKLYLKDGLPYLEKAIGTEDEKCGFLDFSGINIFDVRHENEDESKSEKTSNDLPHFRDVLLAHARRLERTGALDFLSLPYGYHWFENGAEILPWMKELYTTLVSPYPKESGSTFGLDPTMRGLSISPYLQQSFQENTRWKYPFRTFPQWLLQSTQTLPVDMEGNFFFTAFEEHAWKSRPGLQEKFPDPYGDDFHGFKTWFSTFALEKQLMDVKMMAEWNKAYTYNKQNHFSFHQSPTTADNIGINVYGWHAGLFSIGMVAKIFYRVIRSVGIPSNAIEATMTPGKKFAPSADIGIQFSRKVNFPVNLIFMNAERSHQELFVDKDLPKVMRKAKYNILFCHWELDHFPDEDMVTLKDYDEIWVAASFVKHSLEGTPGYDGTPVRVLPIPFEPKLRNTNDAIAIPSSIAAQLQSEGREKPFTFLVVFDFGSYVQRKNPEATIKAFLEAFPIQEDPDHKYQLIVKSHSGKEKQLNDLREEAQNDPRVIFINRLLTDEENAALKEYQDCHVSLHRSEGYGMNILESLGSGIPVIATNYSGNVDFFEKMPTWKGVCSFPVSYAMIPIEEDSGPYKRGYNWADANHHEAAVAMRSVVKNNCKEKLGQKIIQDVVDNFGNEAIGRRMKEYLKDSFPRIQSKTSQ